jgi:hypothetical protein
VLCDFTSTAFYEGKLSAELHLAQQFLKSALANGRGTGPLLLRVPHVGRDTDSPEEAAVIAELACALVDGHATWIDEKGVERPIRWDNILIVAAYNAQVATIKKLLPPQARVGTVDKFQGQEAPIAFYSMASSTAEDAPRGMAFLYSRHRLNVASRMLSASSWNAPTRSRPRRRPLKLEAAPPRARQATGGYRSRRLRSRRGGISAPLAPRSASLAGHQLVGLRGGGDDRRWLLGLLDRQQRHGKHFVHVLDRNELQLAPHGFWHLFQVRLVLERQDNSLEPRAVRCEHFVPQPSDGQNPAP